MEECASNSTAEAPRLPRRRVLDLALSLIVFLLALAGYLRTMRPTFGWGDSSELVTAAYYLGVGHSPGYPTWMLLAHPFARLPIGDVAFRVNLFTALLGAVAVAVFYLVCRCIARNRIAGFIAALTFAFIIAVAQAQIRGLDIVCGCFDVSGVSGKASWEHFALDIGLLLACVLVWRRA